VTNFDRNVSSGPWLREKTESAKIPQTLQRGTMVKRFVEGLIVGNRQLERFPLHPIG
jgi:hypothetical protein